MPATAITMLVSFVATLCSWLFIRGRLHDKTSGNTHQARLLTQGFLYSTFYGLFMFTPHLLLYGHQSAFPVAMAWGFTLGHIFLYLSFIQILRVTFSIVPRLNNKEVWAVVFGVLVTVAITAVNAATMIWGKHPSYNPVDNTVLFNTHALVTAGSGLLGIICAVPAAILMIINGFTNSRLRVRSFLLGAGLIIAMVDGPFVEAAHTSSEILISNTASVLGLIILTAGVAYRMGEKISLARASATAGSR